jgi:regulator of cell morphogenesis and NO signaling
MTNTTITNFYETDHDQLDGLFREFQRMKRTDFAHAEKSFSLFKSGLERHIRWEEEILFPLFEKKTGIISGPTQVMRIEHERIKRHLGAIHWSVQMHDMETDGEERSLLEVLSAHNEKEERILYPAIDHTLEEEEEAAVFSKMKMIAPEGFQHSHA